MEKTIFEQLEEKETGLGSEWSYLSGERDAPPVCVRLWDETAWSNWWKHREKTKARISEILNLLK